MLNRLGLVLVGVALVLVYLRNHEGFDNLPPVGALFSALLGFALVTIAFFYGKHVFNRKLLRINALLATLSFLNFCFYIPFTVEGEYNTVVFFLASSSILFNPPNRYTEKSDSQ